MTAQPRRTHNTPAAGATPSLVADELLAALAPFEPPAAEALGRRPDSLLPGLSPESFDARREAVGAALDALDGANLPTPAEARLAAVLSERLGADAALDDAGFTRSLLAPLATPAHRVREVFDALPTETAGDWDRVGAHLAAVPAALSGWADTLRRAAGAGQVAAARQVRTVAAQCERWVDPAGADVFRRLVACGPGGPTLEAGAVAASEAFSRFAAGLRRDLLPLAPAADAAGADRYRVTARAFLGDNVDLDETYQFGWEELDRIGRAMRSAAAELGHDSVDEASAALDADPAGRLAGAGELLAWLQARLDEATAAVDGVHFDLPPEAGPAECRLSPTASGVMWYSPPDAGFTRPGTVWWSLPAGGSTSAWRQITTVHHEGVPGHHLQTAVAMAEPGLHPWQRVMAHVHGHVEGWAHYAETLADELGLLRGPGERLGMLAGQRWRAARIVVDMGLHLGLSIPAGTGLTDAAAWTPEVGVAFVRAAAGVDETTARFEVDRYLGWPAQALAFRVGARCWRDARADAERRPGWDQRRWHMAALRLGPMGLGPLRRTLAEGGGG